MKRKLSKLIRWSPRRNRIIGLDIGNACVKLTCLNRQHEKFVLAKLELQKIDPHMDHHKGQLEALKKVFQSIPLQGATISAVVNCRESCTKVFVLPCMPEAEIGQALKWKMRDFVSFPMDEAAMDYEILHEITEGGARKLRVAVACCPRSTIDRYHHLLRLAGIKPHTLTQHAFALRNVIPSFCPEQSGAIALLDIGHRFSELLIFKNGELAFSRKLPVASQDFTKGMMQSVASEDGKTELTLEEAETVKRKYGIHVPENAEVLEGGIRSTQLLPLLRPTLEKLVGAIEHSFAYYREKEQGQPVESLLLLGGGANLKNLSATLSETLDIPVHRGDPFLAFPLLEPSLLEDAPGTANRFASAVGAAMASSRAANLLPLEVKQKTRLLVRRSALKGLGAAMVAILMLVYTGMRIKLHAGEQQLSAAELELAALAPQLVEIPSQTFKQNILARRKRWSDALKAISNITPEQIRLTKMEAEQNTLTLKGQIRSSTRSRESVLTEYMRTLQEKAADKVRLLSTRSDLEQELSIFELRLELE